VEKISDLVCKTIDWSDIEMFTKKSKAVTNVNYRNP